jgi:hypothetical protein
MCRAPIYFKGFHKVREQWNEDARENKCDEVFSQALDECFAEAQDFAESLPPRWRDRIMKDAFDNVYKTAVEYKVSLRIAAYMVAIDKVAKTYKFRGGY